MRGNSHVRFGGRAEETDRLKSPHRASARPNHTCASLAIAAGADIKVLQRMMGHASAALTLDRYGHLMPGQARSVADRLDEMARRARPIPDAPVTPLLKAAQGEAACGA